MKVHTPVRLAGFTRYSPLARRIAPALRMIALSALLTVGAFPLTPASRAEGPGSGPTGSGPAGVAQLSRPTIVVLGVGDLDEQGRAHTTTLGKADAIIFSMTEAAITQSHAYHLVSRDQMAQQVKEVKFDSEGWVKPETAQRFGKSTGVQNFISVFVSGGDGKRYNDATATAVTCPANGNVVPDTLTGEPVKSGTNKSSNFSTAFGTAVASGLANHKKNADITSRVGRYLMGATVDIMCRLTKVETGDRDTLTFEGHAIADGNRGSAEGVTRAALKNAFDNLSLYFKKNHPALVGNIVDVTDNKAIVDLGEQDGVREDMGFEICEIKKSILSLPSPMSAMPVSRR